MFMDRHEPTEQLMIQDPIDVRGKGISITAFPVAPATWEVHFSTGEKTEFFGDAGDVRTWFGYTLNEGFKGEDQ